MRELLRRYQSLPAYGRYIARAAVFVVAWLVYRSLRHWLPFASELRMDGLDLVTQTQTWLVATLLRGVGYSVELYLSAAVVRIEGTRGVHLSHACLAIHLLLVLVFLVVIVPNVPFWKSLLYAFLGCCILQLTNAARIAAIAVSLVPGHPLGLASSHLWHSALNYLVYTEILALTLVWIWWHNHRPRSRKSG